MTLPQIVGWTGLALTWATALWRGGRPERLGASLIGVAWILTPIVQLRENWYQPQYGICVIDLVTLIGLTALAVRYQRYWPICAAGFQFIAVLTHLAFLVNPQALFRAYLFGNFSIGFLLLGAVLGGVIMEGATPPPLRPWAWPRSHASRSSP